MKEKLTYSQKAESACYADVPLEKQTIAMLLEYFDAMSRLYQLIPIQRVFEIINQQNPENPVPEEGFIRLTELFLDYNDGKYQYCILSPKEIFDENAVSEPFERYLLHEAALIVDDSYEELVRMPDHCGHMPKELHIAVTADMDTEKIAQEMEEARMTVQMFRRKALQKAGKIAPILKTPSKNGPCPCGSGKKYKRCCGKGK